MSPRGYLGNIFSTIHLFAAVGLIFQPELHVATISTKESPMPFWLYSNALRIAALALRAAGAFALGGLTLRRRGVAALIHTAGKGCRAAG